MNFENDYMQIFDLRDLDLDFGWDHTTNLRVSLTGLYIQLENFLCTDGRRASLQLCTIWQCLGGCNDGCVWHYDCVTVCVAVGQVCRSCEGRYVCRQRASKAPTIARGSAIARACGCHDWLVAEEKTSRRAVQYTADRAVERLGVLHGPLSLCTRMHRTTRTTYEDAQHR